MQYRQIAVLILERYITELDFSIKALRMCNRIFCVLNLRL